MSARQVDILADAFRHVAEAEGVRGFSEAEIAEAVRGAQAGDVMVINREEYQVVSNRFGLLVRAGRKVRSVIPGSNGGWLLTIGRTRTEHISQAFVR